MQDSLARTASGPGTLAVFNYLDATTRPSLFRNGEVLTGATPTAVISDGAA